jgi:PilZ domain
MTSDSRIAPRYTFEARILIRLCRDQRTWAVSGWTRDLIEGGLGAFVAEKLEVGERVVLLVELPALGKQEIAARVARHVGTQYGFQFTALSSEQRSAIQMVLQGQSAVPGP